MGVNISTSTSNICWPVLDPFLGTPVQAGNALHGLCLAALPLSLAELLPRAQKAELKLQSAECRRGTFKGSYRCVHKTISVLLLPFCFSSCY